MHRRAIALLPNLCRLREIAIEACRSRDNLSHQLERLSPAGVGLLRVPCLHSSSLCSMDFVSKVRLLAPAPFPNDDPASIKGSASTEQKRLSANVFAWHIADFPGSRVFGHHEFKDMKLTEINIWKMNAGEVTGLLEEAVSPEAARRMSLRGQTVCELTVTEGTLSIVEDGANSKELTFTPV